jgi:hypothetical protein
MKILRSLCLTSLAALVSSPALAAPAWLLNKSITVSYATTIPGKRSDGAPVRGSRVSVRTIYVSSAGRIFARVLRRDGNLSQQKEAGPGETGNTVRIAGDTLVGVMKFPSGAAQMIISFGGGGQSCSASIVAGRESGRPIQWKGVDGMMRQATGPVSFSNVTCSIVSGNAFGGQG